MVLELNKNVLLNYYMKNNTSNIHSKYIHKVSLKCGYYPYIHIHDP